MLRVNVPCAHFRPVNEIIELTRSSHAVHTTDVAPGTQPPAERGAATGRQTPSPRGLLPQIRCVKLMFMPPIRCVNLMFMTIFFTKRGDDAKEVLIHECEEDDEAEAEVLSTLASLP